MTIFTNDVKCVRASDIAECDCSKCEHRDNCKYKNRYVRFPRNFGGLGLCPNISYKFIGRLIK